MAIGILAGSCLAWYGSRRRAALERHLADLAADPSGAPRWRPSPGWVQFIDAADLSESLESLRQRLIAEERQSRDVARAFDSIFEGFPDPLILVDEQGRIARANKASEDLLPANAEGRALDTVFRVPELTDAVERTFRTPSSTLRNTGSADRSSGSSPRGCR